MEETGSARSLSLSQGPEALPPGDSSSPSPGLDRLTPESSGNSSNEDLGREGQGLAMDPLLSSGGGDNDSSDDGDDSEEQVYKLHVRGPRDTNGSHGRLRGRLTYSADEERAVVAKFDRRLVLFVAFLYMLSFLDRSSASCLLLLHATDYFPTPFLADRGLFLNPVPGSLRVRPPKTAPRVPSDLPWGPKA